MSLMASITGKLWITVTIRIIITITDRYKLLYSPAHQLDFTGLQLELLTAFHHDLADAATSNSIQPLSRQQAAYLNTALYIAMVMREWGEQTVRYKLSAVTICITVYRIMGNLRSFIYKNFKKFGPFSKIIFRNLNIFTVILANLFRKYFLKCLLSVCFCKLI